MNGAIKRCALVTGATGALGAASCERLIAPGMTVVATERDGVPLPALSHRLPGLVTVCRDLTRPDQVDQLLRQGTQVNVLVAMAGAAESVPFERRPWARVEDEIVLNAATVARPVHAYGAGMLAARSGLVITVASTAAGRAGRAAPCLASYAASKAFVLVLSRALALEWRGRGVHACCCTPGPIRSRFAERSGLGDRPRGLDAGAVADAAHRASDAGRTTAFPGLNSLLRWMAYHPMPDRVLAPWISNTARHAPR